MTRDARHRRPDRTTSHFKAEPSGRRERRGSHPRDDVSGLDDTPDSRIQVHRGLARASLIAIPASLVLWAIIYAAIKAYF